MILYNILTLAALFLIILGFPVILPLILFSEKRKKTFLQRTALMPLPEKVYKKKKKKAGIWIHALSLGEVVSAVPLVKAMEHRFAQKEIFFSVSTKTGFETAQKQLKNHVKDIFFFPYDLLFSVKKVIDQVSPEFVIIIETDIWPNFMAETEKQNIPVFLVNTRLSPRSFSGYKRFSFFIGPVLNKFSKICTQSEADAKSFEKLIQKSDNIIITGNIKFDQPVEPVPDEDIKQMRFFMNIDKDCKVIVAGSTHEGEESVLAEVFLKLKTCFNNLCLIAVPRNPDRAGSVCGIFQSKGIKTLKMADIELKHEPFDVMVVDRIHVLKKLYSIADISFTGGSLAPFGGHNPLEPAVFAKPVIFGPYMSDFNEISKLLLDSGGAVQVKDANDLYTAFSEFLNNPEKAENAGQQAFKVFNENKGAVKRTVDIIEQYLSR